MSLSVSEAHIGQQGKCSRCGTIFTIEMPRGPAAAPFAPTSPYSPPAQAAATMPDAPAGAIRVGEGISRGFAILHSNLGAFILITLCLMGISFGIGIAGQIPCIGLLIALVNGFLVQPALTCGFYRACLKQHDGGQAEVGDLFGEFNQWVDILLVSLIRAVIAIVVCLPGLIVLGIALAPVIVATIQQQQPPTPNIPIVVVGVILMLMCSVIAALGLVFTYPALVDRRRGCVDALKTSWQLMTSNPVGAVGAVLLAGVFGMLGFLACCVGLLYAIPAIQCMFASIYRTAVAGQPRSWAPPGAAVAAAWPQQPIAGTPIAPPAGPPPAPPFSPPPPEQPPPPPGGNPTY
jgi:hypothetical protein